MSKATNILSEAELSAFCQQINMIIKAGFPIYYGISLLRDDATDESTKALFTQIYEPMERGMSFYNALSSTNAFPQYMLKMVISLIIVDIKYKLLIQQVLVIHS